jgi:hypothetical protein
MTQSCFAATEDVTADDPDHTEEKMREILQNSCIWSFEPVLDFEFFSLFCPRHLRHPWLNSLYAKKRAAR